MSVANPALKPPPYCETALKEWAGVCCTLASGRQSILLRKGGIAEPAGRFTPSRPWFWLCPTSLHQGQQGLIEDPTLVPPPSPDTSTSGVLVGVAGVRWISNLEELLELTDLHVWTEETVRKRFDYKRPGTWLMLVRAHVGTLAQGITQPPEFAGCSSWVTLPAPLTTDGLRPVLNDHDFQRLLDRLGPFPSDPTRPTTADPSDEPRF